MKTAIKLLLFAALPLSFAPCSMVSHAQTDSDEFDKPPVAISPVHDART